MVSAIQAQGGDVLKLIGDGVLAMFQAEERGKACAAAIAAATGARERVVALNERRSAESLPVTEMYLGLHIGEVFFGNVGSPNRLDFTVVDQAVNEASRIAAMCRSVDQPSSSPPPSPPRWRRRPRWPPSAATRCGLRHSGAVHSWRSGV